MKGLAEIARDNAPKKSRRSIMVAINEARDQLKAAGVVVDSKAMIEEETERTVPCPSCSGTGQRHLTRVERDTLASVDETWSSTTTIHYNLGGILKHTALLNRLNDLAAFGLIERRRVGNGIEWRLT